MKKLAVVSLVIIIAAMSVIAVSAAPRGGYYDQIGNKYWCNSDSYGCWVTGEDGGHEYIMFWSEAAAAAIMGPNSGAPVGTLPGTSTLNLAAPVAEAAAAAEKKEDGGTKPECEKDADCKSDEECKAGKCEKKSTDSCPNTPESCQAANPAKTCTVDGTGASCTCNCWCENAKTDEQCRADNNSSDYHWEDSSCSCEPD